MSKKIREVFDQIEAGMPEQSAIPDDVPLIELADMVIRGKVKHSPSQQRMLIEMLPFVAPKLTAVAHLHEGDTFAARLEKRINRSSANDAATSVTLATWQNWLQSFSPHLC